MGKSIILPFYIDDTVMIAGRAGTVSQITIRATDRLYYVATVDEAGKHYSDYFAESLLSAPAGASGGPFISSVEYFNLYTEAEQDAIFGSDVPAVRRAVAFAGAAAIIDMSDPVVIAGIDQLAALGLITSDRDARIKSGQPPVVPVTPALPA